MNTRNARALAACALLGWCVAVRGAAPALPAQLLVMVHPAQTAGIDGRAWDATFPGASTIDAVHRTVLVRFPGAATALAKALDAPATLVKAELVLDYDGYEITPGGYLGRFGLGENKWKQNPPQWHVMAWMLRRPWNASEADGPTFNASRKDAAYWAKYGASDTRGDRYEARFGPAELSHVNTEARVDVTAALLDPAFGRDPQSRLRAIERSGFILAKLETYDDRYRDPGDAYEWAVPTGAHGLRFRNARLVTTLQNDPRGATRAASRPGTAAPSEAPQTAPSPGPTALMPTAAEIRQFADKVALRRSAGVPEWQRRRIAELSRVGGDRVSAWDSAVTAADPTAFSRLVRELLSVPPRYWQGWSIQDDLLVWYLYRDVLPAYARDHVRRYWESWLMPDLAAKDLFHPQSKEAAQYWQSTKDWRGRTSFYRDGYNYAGSTQNFNHMAATGALLGGAIVDSDQAIADGRHGLEHLLLRFWAMLDGSTQEMLDHYYFSITLSAQKMFADFAPAPIDRLMGRIMLDRSIELLATAYHPALRRVVSPSGRARLSGVLLEQDGIYGVLHALSRKGVLHYLDEPINARVRGMPVWGVDFPPGRVAVQSYAGRWGEEWVSNVIDDKSFPFEATATETIRGSFKPPLWRRTYLGRHYGLASQDIKAGTVDFIAQWNHRREPARRMEDIGTLTLRYAVNEPDMATTSGGTMPHAGGVLTFQHRNRAIVCTKPRTEKERTLALAGKDGLRSLASVIALWNFRSEPGWEIQVDGQLLTRYPARIRAGQVITIKDGVSYIGVIPLPASDLGRRDEVVIGPGGAGKAESTGAPLVPALTITSYNFQSERGAAPETLDWPAITTSTYGGFIVEMGDAEEHGDFAAFTRKLRANRATAEWDLRSHVLHVKYRSGRDLLEMGCSTDFAQSDVHYPLPPGEQAKAIRYRRINGAWPYLLPGIDRDTTVSQQGTTGRLEKNGAVLLSEKGRKAYLQTDPASGTYVGYNPLPDATEWSLGTPEGRVVRPNGKVGLLRVRVDTRANRVAFEYAAKPGEGVADATHLELAGFSEEPVVERNGARVSAPLEKTTSRGKPAYRVPMP